MEVLINAISENLTIVVIGSVFVVGMSLKALTNIVASTAKERSRREIAAYIAEGSLSAEQGERLLRADVNRACRIV